MITSAKTIAKSKDWEKNTVKLEEVKARGINPNTNDYGYQLIYVVTIYGFDDECTQFIYLDKETAFRMFQKFLSKY